MAELRVEVADAEAMAALGRRLGSRLRRGDLVILSGELGAGKTTLTRGIGEGMGVRGPVTSPTFVLSRVHPPEAPGREVPLVHVDAYRLGGARELDDLDLDFEGAAVVVEWGDGMLDDELPESWLRIRIDRLRSLGDPSSRAARAGTGTAEGAAEDVRHVTIEGHGPRWAGLEALA